MSSNPIPSPRLEVFVRSLGAPDTNPKRGVVLERVGRLAKAGIVAGYSVRIVGRTICPTVASATEPGRDICRRVAAFREWAATTGLADDAIVKYRTMRSVLTGEEHEVIVFPTVVVAAFDDDHLWGVAPCSDGETIHTVTDLLDALEEGRSTDAFPPGGRSPPDGRRRDDSGMRSTSSNERQPRTRDDAPMDDGTREEPTLR